MEERVKVLVFAHGPHLEYASTAHGIGPLILTNPLLPGEIGFLPYIMSKEELDETSKEETIETLDKDET